LGLFVLVAAAGTIHKAWQRKRAEGVIARWAEQHGFRLSSIRPRVTNLGLGTPWPLQVSQKQEIYRAIMTDSEGQTREAWLLVGKWWGIDPDDQVENQVTFEWIRPEKY
jgi:hypothetical protein